ncbi:MAG: GNAT family N-acetyltransferase [Candidatus Hydrogenedentes bacterium]|nr:GNAT family N-acetyltransferase [Candidatus Hydrogenedentota bacterium]
MSDYTISTASREEVDIAVAFAAGEGWNPGKHDADCFHAADLEGFLVGRLGGEVIASVSAVRYGKDFGFLGFYVVKAEFRGRGYGLPLFEAAVRQLESVKSAGLDGVVAQQQNYMKSGFVLAYRNIRFQGVGGGEMPSGVTPIADIAFGVVERYDSVCFGTYRTAFLRAWLSQPEGMGYGILGSDGELIGYGVLRPCQTGYKIGPLFADSADAADCLYRALASKVPGAAVYLDVPEANAEAAALAKRHGLAQCFETARMYKGETPNVPVGRVFGVTTFELG